MKIEYSSKFIRNFKKLPIPLQKKVVLREKEFKENIFNPILKTHKLKGILKDCFSFSVDYSYRIIFKAVDENTFVFLDIGNHSIYN